MNRLAKILGFVVLFAVLTLAVVAGCAVNVEPSPEKDGGGTTSGGDGATGDDVSPGDDADVGGDDGSTATDDVDDDLTPCGRVCGKLVQCGVVTDGADRETCKELCRAGAQPASIYQCILDHECNELAEACPAPGTDGGRVEEDGGTTVTVDENGNATLRDCDEEEVLRGPALYFEFNLEFKAGSGHLIEVEFNGFAWRMNPEPGPNEEAPPDRMIGVGWSFPDPPMEIPTGHGLVRVSNHSDNSIELQSFEVYSSREEYMNSALPIWSQKDGYPVIGPHQAVTLGELEGGETEDTYDPLCTIHLENLEE